MKDLEAVDEVVDLPHEALHEDHLGQADAHVLELRGERLHLREVVELHGGGEVQQHVRQVGTLVGQLVEDCVSDQFDRQLDIPQWWPEAYAAQTYSVIISRDSPGKLADDEREERWVLFRWR